MEFEFEFDPAKSEANRAKHGIDFVETQVLWGDAHRLSYETRSDTENRWVATSILDKKFWTEIGRAHV